MRATTGTCALNSTSANKSITKRPVSKATDPRRRTESEASIFCVELGHNEQEPLFCWSKQPTAAQRGVRDCQWTPPKWLSSRLANSLQPCRSQPAVRSCPALFQVTPRCGSRCPSVIQLALVYPGTHPESCGAAPRLQREAIDLPATETTWSRIAWSSFSEKLS